jgi:WD40 repeat protein
MVYWLVEVRIKKLAFWNTKDGTIIKELTDQNDGIRCLVVLPDGTLASGSNGKTISIWRLW